MGYLEWKRNAILSDSNWYVDALAAYKFVRASSAADARIDLTGHGYDLVKKGNATWNAETGYYFQGSDTQDNKTGVSYLTNVNLAKQKIKTIVIRYKNMPYGQTLFRLPFAATETLNPSLYFGTMAGISGIPANHYAKTYNFIVVEHTVESYEEVDGYIINNHYFETNKPLAQTGVVAYTNEKIYYNGAKVASSKETIDSFNVYGTDAVISSGLGGYVLALVLYDKVLTDAEIKKISEEMLEL